MSSHRTLRRAGIAVALLLAFLCQGTWALAGVTGNMTGSVKDTSGAPIAGVEVQAVAPSETRTATTDAAGHFVFLSLAPDTYTVNLTRSGYQSVSFPGVMVFADQTQNVAYTLIKTLKTIARVTSQAGASLVKSGVGSDLYSVNAAQAQAAQALGGGGNLNNAYSAMATIPGVQMSQGGMGWDFNAAYVRGQNSYYTGYEYDGIPVNRAFDNYNSSTEASLGLQELQVYTGGGPVVGGDVRHGRIHQPGHQDRYVPGLRPGQLRLWDARVLPSGPGRDRRIDAGSDLQLLHRARGLQSGLPLVR